MRSPLLLMRKSSIGRLWSHFTCGRYRCSQAPDQKYDSDEEASVLTKHKWDVVISGAGLAGAALACALGTSSVFAGKKVLLIERRSLRTEHEGGEGWSNRVYALTPGSKTFLEELGVWDLLPKCKVQVINRMQVWESHSDAAITFDSVTPDGVVAYDVDLPNLMDALYKRLSRLSHDIHVCSKVRVADYELPMLQRKNFGESCPPVRVRLQDGCCFETRMLVGADGFNSQVKKAMGIKSLQWNYNQKSIIATLQLAECVDNSSAWQRFLPQGVVALLPLDSEHTSLVWSLRADLADKLMHMDEDSFVDALNHSLAGAGKRNAVVDSIMSGVTSALGAVGLGTPGMQLPMRVLRVIPGSRATFPLGMSHATHYVLPRVALMGDAAHRIHPMAGQGANLGIGDAQGLAELLIKSVRDGNRIVPFDTLLEYETQMQRRNVPFLCAIEALVSVYQMNVAPVVLARSFGLQLLNSLTGIKDWITCRASY